MGGVSIKDIEEEYSTKKIKASRVSRSTWHSRLGHPNKRALMKLDVLQELTEKENKGEDEDCIPCIAGKMKRDKFPVDDGEKAKEVLDRIHSDVMGPITPASEGHKRFVRRPGMCLQFPYQERVMLCWNSRNTSRGQKYCMRRR